MAMLPELILEDINSIDEGLPISNEERDLPKYLNMRFDFCDDDDEIPESEDAVASVKFPSKVSLPASGFFLCLTSDVRMKRMMTAKVVPVMIAISNKSPCDLPSIDTFGTETIPRKQTKKFFVRIVIGKSN